MDYGKIKKCPDEIRCLDWITLIDRYWLVINDWFADIDWPDHLTCPSYSIRGETPLEDLVNKDSKFTHSTISATLYSRQWVKMYNIFDDQNHDYSIYFLCTRVLISFMRMWMNIGDQHLFQQSPYLCYFKLSNFLFEWCPPICKTERSFKHNPSFSREL